MRAELHEADGQTQVTVTTDINVTGKPAQFGRGVMADVGAKIIDRFATNLHEMLDAEEATDAGAMPDAAAGSTTAEGVPAAEAVGQDERHGSASAPGPRKVAYRAPRDEALDLVDVAGEATAKRLAPVLALVLLVLVVVWRRRRARRARLIHLLGDVTRPA